MSKPNELVWVTLKSGRIEQYPLGALPKDAILWCRSGDKEWKPVEGDKTSRE